MPLLTDSDRQRLKQRYTLPQFAPAVARLRETALDRMDGPLNVPDEGAGWSHNYTCPTHATRLIYDRDKPHSHVCEVDGEVFSGGLYDEAWRAFHNHALIRSAHAAAVLWAMTGDSAFGDHAAQVLVEYARRYPQYPVHGKNAGQGRVMGQSLDEAVWAIPAAWSYELIRDHLTGDQQALIENNLLRGLGDHLLTQLWTRIHNIQCWHLAGLATLGVVLEEEHYIQPTFDPDWGLAAQVQEGILEDGWWWEGSPHYHFYTAQAITSLGMAIRHQHPDLLDNPRLKRMFTAPLEMLRPDLSLPSLNDGWIDITYGGGTAQYVQVYERTHSFWHDAQHAQAMAQVYARYTERDSADALLFGPETLPAPQPVDSAHVLHPASGYAVLKGDDTQLLLKYGPHGGGHGHPDKLALVLWGHGARLSPDLGTPGYGIPMNNTWYRHTLSHNTILIDGENQPAQTGRLLRFEAIDAHGTVHVADAEAAWTEAGVYEGVRVRRGILWRGRYFIDLVRVTCPQPRQIDLAWHHTGALDAAAMPDVTAADIRTDQPGYQHLTHLRQTAASQWRALWRTAGGPGTQLWACHLQDTQTLLADAPFNPASEALSLILRRVHGTEALFLSVVEPFAQQPAITQVTWEAHDQAIQIQVAGDGVADRWHIQLAQGQAQDADGALRYTFAG